jgi:hypothetical protein
VIGKWGNKLAPIPYEIEPDTSLQTWDIAVKIPSIPNLITSHNNIKGENWDIVKMACLIYIYQNFNICNSKWQKID